MPREKNINDEPSLIVENPLQRKCVVSLKTYIAGPNGGNA